MIKCKWHSYTIATEERLQQCLSILEEHQDVIYGGFDTETTGLNIKLNKPFIFVGGFVNADQTDGYTFAADIQTHPTLAAKFIQHWHAYAEKLRIYCAHNVKYDLHMMNNIGLRYNALNISDTMFFIRYGSDAIPERFGGVPLALKKFSKQYIDPQADKYEKKVQSLRSAIAKQHNNVLRAALKECTPPQPDGPYKSWTLGTLTDIFKDKVIEPEDLPEEVQETYIEWLTELPIWLRNKVHGLVSYEDIPYDKIDRQTVLEYAHWDVIYMLEVLIYMIPIVNNRKNTVGVQIENALVYPLTRVESVGFKIDIDYLRQARIAVKQYILIRRQRLYELAGLEFKIGQHALVKEILNDNFDLAVTSTENNELTLLHAQLIIEKNTTGAIEFIEVLQELRTLEKWYSVYLLRYLENVDENNMMYTQLNQVGAVSGRFSSDFQQFPKDAISDADGNELFNPRKIIVVEDPAQEFFAFVDYSQIELRFQAIYTILVGEPDVNLCRAYMPYKCMRVTNSGKLIPFSYESKTDLKNWDKEWFYEEELTKLWTPTDVHGTTTTVATGLTPDDPEFKSLRGKIGKRTNFAKNYGAKRGKIRVMFPEKTEEEITKIDEAYYTAFPGIKAYHEYCYQRALSSAYTSNLFGIKYYNATGHKLINLLTQGSAAYLIKLAIIANDKYIRKYNLKSKQQMQIHDEIMFKWRHDEVQHLKNIKQIMETWEDTLVPIVADVDAAYQNWAEKSDIKI